MTDIDSMPGKLDALATRVGRLETAMVENTEITRDIRDALVAGRVLSRAAKWLAGIVASVAAIWAAWHQVK